MDKNYGEFNARATKAINRVARQTSAIGFRKHSRDRMDERGFDDSDVLMCLRRGKAFGPELQGQPAEWRFNVVHSGLHVRVVVGMDPETDLGGLQSIEVASVIQA